MGVCVWGEMGGWEGRGNGERWLSGGIINGSCLPHANLYFDKLL